MITISPTYLFRWKTLTFVGLCASFWNFFLRKNSSQITYANHMTMTTSGADFVMAWLLWDKWKCEDNIGYKHDKQTSYPPDVR